jgi:hypothetical protein
VSTGAAGGRGKEGCAGNLRKAVAAAVLLIETGRQAAWFVWFVT